MKVRVALLAGSPVYYQAPLFRLLAQDPRIDFTAIYSSSAGATRPYDNEFGMPVEWGVDSLGGYRHRFLRKADSNPTGGNPLSLRDYDVVPLLLAERYDVLWIQGYHTVTGALARLTQGITRGATCYRDDANLLTPRPRWKTLLKTVGVRPLFAGSTGLFFGTANRAWFRRWGMRDDQLFFVPHAADYNRLLASAPQEKDSARAALGISGKGPVILTVGRLMAKKNPLMLLEAFRRVRERRDCTLLVVGSGELEPAMRARAEAGNVADVKFAGFLSQREIGVAYRAADIFSLVSSHDETWGMVVNEAMAFGLPVVVSDRVGCAVDLVASRETGFVVPYDDASACAAALDALVADAALRRRLGENAARVVRSWDYSTAYAGVISAIRHAVGAKRWQEACVSTRESEVVS